jgi:hypothetical protein
MSLRFDADGRAQDAPESLSAEFEHCVAVQYQLNIARITHNFHLESC